MYKKTVLKNNLRLITHEMSDRDSVAIGIWVGVGGRYESDKIKGGTGGSLRSQTGTFSKAYIVKMIRDKGFHHPYDQSSWQLSPTVKGTVQHEYVKKTEAGKHPTNKTTK